MGTLSQGRGSEPSYCTAWEARVRGFSYPPACPPKKDLETELAHTIRILKGFFGPRSNVVGERYRFRSRGQLAHESTAQWVSVLRQLAATCDYQAKAEEFIRDQVVEKTTSASLRQRLLMEPALTLEKTLQIAESIETASKEASAMQHSSVLGGTVGAVSRPLQRPGARRVDSGPRPGSGSQSRPVSTPQSRPSPGASGEVKPTCFAVAEDIMPRVVSVPPEK